MYDPVSTYRIQFNREFTFSDLEKILPYLHKLGIRTIYASPVFAALPGSSHGYDIVDPNQINPVLGDIRQLKRIAKRLKSLGMGWIQDFVPNHMAYAPENPWVADMWIKGPLSHYSAYFDTEPGTHVMAPFLEMPLHATIHKGQLQLVFTAGKLQFRYRETLYPVNHLAYASVLQTGAIAAQAEASGAISTSLASLASIKNKDAYGTEWEKLLASLVAALTNETFSALFDQQLQAINANPEWLNRLCDMQYYRLCNWQETEENINYRRFFTVNGLIGLRMESPAVFAACHQLLRTLAEEQIIQGVRIDHIDGLYDPTAYLQQLRQLLGKSMYIVVEKILGQHETYPSCWPIQGTTGYDFLTQVNHLLIAPSSKHAFARFYKTLGEDPEVEHQVLRCKASMLTRYMQGEWRRLESIALELAANGLLPLQDLSQVKKLIGAFLIFFPVYRFYPGQLPLTGKDKKLFEQTLSRIQVSTTLPKALTKVFKAAFTTDGIDKDKERAGLHFLRKCMQVSGPLMAKGVEDRWMYQHTSYLARNEVGDALDSFGITSETFHREMIRRSRVAPLSINATATHDTKRGEDARVRLQILSHYKRIWLKRVSIWLQQIPVTFPDLRPADKYFIFQTVFATLPFPDTGAVDYKDRLDTYLKKAAREAGLHSSWDQPDENYERALLTYAAAVTDQRGTVRRDMQRLWVHVKNRFRTHSIIQLCLKCLCPGIPDIYQGTECTDLSFVDPDNRRPIDYTLREHRLDQVMDLTVDTLEKNGKIDDASVKLFTLRKLLSCRNRHPKLCSEGLYIPLKAASGVIAFTRHNGTKWLLVVAFLHEPTTAKVNEVTLPAEAPSKWKDLFSGKVLEQHDFSSGSIYQGFPVVVAEPANDYLPGRRKAGVLMPVFSLSSPFGIGDIGYTAYNFVSFLARAGQRCWQLLPMGPLHLNDPSPYTPVSAFAGAPIYIDPRKLYESGLLDRSDIAIRRCCSGNKVDYTRSQYIKEALFRKAWVNFRKDTSSVLHESFDEFVEKEKIWLTDFALFVVAKKVHENKPWYAWPEALKDRDPAALSKLAHEFPEELAYQQWLQFLFFRQWQELKAYCRKLDVILIGDLPFYMSVDAVDVWVQPSFYHVDASGVVTAAAGVPPDYFSKTGQHWGVPTYNWTALAKSGYSWWLLRLQKLAELYDITRLDHFRAFYDFWEITGGHGDARLGQWKPGPGTKLFDLIAEMLPDLPFIAEDLGDVHEGIYALRDRYQIPGMRILQFGFAPFHPALPHLPHRYIENCVAYTGTHDNPTLIGWYRSLTREDKIALSDYFMQPISTKSIPGIFITALYRSVAETIIIPLPDLLALPENARINTPATTAHNWKWQLTPGQLHRFLARRILDCVRRYYR